MEGKYLMKCIYCNSDTELTSSDIITYAITGAKVKKSFVCHTHNSFTNESYEKKFVSDLDFFRNHLGLTTRDGKLIKYKADITIEGKKVHNIEISNRESLYSSKRVNSGKDDNGNKVLLGSIEKLEKISKEKIPPVDTRDVVLHKTISSDCFIGYHALHSVAKMAYEWYCYSNDIEEYKDEYKEIVNYILGNNDINCVEIIMDNNYYSIIDRLSEIGTNSIFQYDDIDGFRYVVFDLWKTVAYRIKICKSSLTFKDVKNYAPIDVFLYRIDESKSKSHFIVLREAGVLKESFKAISAENITTEVWGYFVNRIEQIMTTFVLSIHNINRQVEIISSKLNKYINNEIGIAELLGFEDDNIEATLKIIDKLYLSKDKYDKTKCFNKNLSMILELDGDTITQTNDQKISFLKELVKKHENDKLSEYIQTRIDNFKEIYQFEEELLTK